MSWNDINDYIWCGLRVCLPLRDLSQMCLGKVHALLRGCLKHHPRWTVIRIDLRVPLGIEMPNGAVTKFIESLKAQLSHVESQKASSNERVYPHMLHYIWVREQASAEEPHYHLALLLNRDAYFGLGDYSLLNAVDASPDRSLAGRICKAWGSALGVNWRTALTAVHFPKNSTYPLMRDRLESADQFSAVFQRLSYLAKHATKLTSDGGRSFGMSQIPASKVPQGFGF